MAAAYNMTSSVTNRELRAYQAADENKKEPPIILAGGDGFARDRAYRVTAAMLLGGSPERADRGNSTVTTSPDASHVIDDRNANAFRIISCTRRD